MLDFIDYNIVPLTNTVFLFSIKPVTNIKIYVQTSLVLMHFELQIEGEKAVLWVNTRLGGRIQVLVGEYKSW